MGDWHARSVALWAERMERRCTDCGEIHENLDHRNDGRRREVCRRKRLTVEEAKKVIEELKEKYRNGILETGSIRSHVIV